jgi:hypothetical protein
VRTPRLHGVGELLGLGLERGRQPVEGGEEVLDHGEGRRHVDARRERVVAALRGVHVVVGVDLDPGLRGERRDDLVGVHVGAGARPGLEDVDGELAVVGALHDGVRSGDDGLRLVVAHDAEGGVGRRGGCLDMGQRLDVPGLQGQATDREVLDRALGLGPPQGVARHLDLAHGVVLDACLVHALDATPHPAGRDPADAPPLRGRESARRPGERCCRGGQHQG